MDCAALVTWAVPAAVAVLRHSHDAQGHCIYLTVFACFGSHAPAGISSDRGQQYAISSSTGTAGTGSSSAAAGGSPSSARGQAGFWGRTYGRPSSNPAPSRPAAGHLASATGVGPGRSVTPGRGPAGSATAAWYSGSGSQQPQLVGDFFTAQSLKVPQRLGELARAHVCMGVCSR